MLNFLLEKVYFKYILPSTKSGSSREGCGRYFAVIAHRKLKKKPKVFFHVTSSIEIRTYVALFW